MPRAHARQLCQFESGPAGLRVANVWLKSYALGWLTRLRGAPAARGKDAATVGQASAFRINSPRTPVSRCSSPW